ncbi:hypothetical protein N7532_006025 [Penicillium argentinense]|uniref:Arylsulfotransferase n=1 Tax=Penicillium argentinense TaxID=1131581 RepID=A0A9W9FF47_9EURO|nr:uncharacterized protein N7532_006025 [Penicillium argentinense]KAJ5099024.1 hypothetical protein N7532_006025 [Penicillium argentinense]
MATFKKAKFLAAFILSSALPHTLADNQYRSRPDLAPPRLNITIPSPTSNSTEYVFIAPYSGDLEKAGPYVYRKDGDLVWAGTGYYSGFVGNFHVTKYQGKDVLQAFQGTIDSSHGEGFGQHVLLDQSYQHVVTSLAGNHRVSSIHEFNVVDGKSALIEIFGTVPANLTAYGGNSSQTWLGNGIFQEVDISTGELLFEWNALNHLDPADSLVPLASTAANNALTSASAWDYLHINSIDKDEEGNYLVSARHFSTIYKINGTDGSIIWQLGGRKPSFSLSGNWSFGFQHHARWRPELVKPGSNTEVISFFDNSGNGAITYNDVSSALVVEINYTAKTASIRRKLSAPYGLQAKSQGNAQLLPDGRVFVNWGSEGALTEFSADDKIAFHAFIEQDAVSYRGFVGNWTGLPVETPALVALREGPNKMKLYVSWNGDTEAVAWRFFYSRSKGPSQKVLVGQAEKRSFETVFTWDAPRVLSSNARFFAQAVGWDGALLSQSAVVGSSVDVGVVG